VAAEGADGRRDRGMGGRPEHQELDRPDPQGVEDRGIEFAEGSRADGSEGPVETGPPDEGLPVQPVGERPVGSLETQVAVAPGQQDQRLPAGGGAGRRAPGSGYCRFSTFSICGKTALRFRSTVHCSVSVAMAQPLQAP